MNQPHIPKTTLGGVGGLVKPPQAKIPPKEYFIVVIEKEVVDTMPSIDHFDSWEPYVTLLHQ